jgi:dTDP-4-dehydrorhamnose reductase
VRILVTGAGGMLGTDLVEHLARGHHAVPMTRREADLEEPGAARRFLLDAAPEAVVHAAAFTDVDACETQVERARRVNAGATREVARAAREAGAHLVYVSTDYVFDGTRPEPYREDDPPSPVNRYGESKLEGEREVLAFPGFCVARTSWLYGRHGRNFVDTILRLLDEREELRVVEDQVGSPTWTRSLCAMLAALLERREAGVFHATNRGATSWFGLARETARLSGRDPAKVKPCPSDEFRRPAPRPANSVLSPERYRAAGLPEPPGWREALRSYLEERRAVQ